MRGINPSHEECMSSFEELGSVVEDLVKLGLPEAIGKMYQNSISSAHGYVKNHFPNNIQFESKCASHCAKFALSEKLSKNFKSQCEHGDDHPEVCSHCDAIPKLLMSLLGAVKFVRENFEVTELQKNEMYYAIDQAQQSISRYKNHLMQSYVQNTFWEEMLNMEKLDTAYITQDWCMKFLPIQFRENQINWFGKKVSFYTMNITYISCIKILFSFSG